MLRILIADGNERATRAKHREARGKTSAEAYADIVHALAGARGIEAACSLFSPADADGGLPAGTGLADFDGLVFTGSSLKVGADKPEVARQLDLMRAAFAAGLPAFGSCWGVQVAAVVAGGEAGPNPRGPEYGFARRIVPTAEGKGHAMLAERGFAWDAPAIHSDAVLKPPPGAVVLAFNGLLDVQAVEIRHEAGWFWGTQYHPELDPEELAVMLRMTAEGVVGAGLAADDAAVAAYAAEVESLSDAGTDHARHFAWRHGLGPEILDAPARRREIGNFIARLARGD